MANSFGFVFNLIALMVKLRFTINILITLLCKRNTAVKKHLICLKCLQTKCYCTFVHIAVLLNEKKVHNTLLLNSLLNFVHNNAINCRQSCD